jgi:hypothetical protein
MTDESEGDFYSTESLEALVNQRLHAQIALAADPAGAAKRLKELRSATAEHVRQQGAAEEAVARAETVSARLAADEASLATRTADFQSWVDATEKNYRDREARIRTNEMIQEAREKKLLEQEADLARRVSAHERRLQNLKETLA